MAAKVSTSSITRMICQNDILMSMLAQLVTT